jgi:hypothetical protein
VAAGLRSEAVELLSEAPHVENDMLATILEDLIAALSSEGSDG